MNRRAARTPSQATVTRLRELLEQTTRTQADAEAAKDELYLAAYQAHKVEGAGLQQIGDALGFAKSTVFGWVKRGEQLRGR